MKHKLLYLFTLLFLATSVGWGQNKEGENTNDLKTETITIGGKQISCFFAKGKAITISESSSSENVKIILTDTGESIEIPSTTHVFGGSNSVTVDNTSITMESGTIARIYGGGFGSSSETPGNVTGMASITVKGGVISDLLVGGGSQYAKTNTVSINISGSEEKKVTVECLYAGGFGYPATSSLIDNWDNAVCGTKIVNMTISNAVFPAGIGCGGGQAYTYTGSSTVNIKNATLGALYGTLSNGYADNIDATLIGCTFKPMENNEEWYEIGAINRGKINTVSFSFDSCSFENTDQLDICLGAIEGWGDSDTNGDPAPEITGSIAYSFTGCTNTPDVVIGEGIENIKVELTGAKAKLKKYHRGNGVVESKGPKEWNTFNITNGNWIFNNGLVMNEDVTLTNNGSLSITCPTVEDLVAAVKAKANTITLDAGTYSLTSQLVIDNLLELSGKGKTETIITADESWTGGEDAKDLIKVAVTDNVTTAASLLRDDNNATNDVSLSKLTISGAKGNGLVATTPVSLADVALTNNAEAGLMVASTTVTATNLTTSGNGESGVNVEEEAGTSGSTNFTFDETSSFYEDNKIKANAENLVTVPTNSAWTPVQGENNYVYTTAPSITTETLSPFPGKNNWKGTYTFVYANGKPITITQSEAGKVKISVDGTNEYVELLESANPVIFGGSKDKTAESSTITMNSGTIYMLLGGGYGTIETDKTSEKYAGVTGSTKISIKGGKITNTLFGGGLYYNHSKDVTIDIKGDLTVGQWLICGGFESGVTSGANNYPDFDKSNNTVESATLTIDGGTYGYIAVGGTDGAKGYIKESKATIKNAKASGLYANGSNGRSDKVSIVAENCTFKKSGSGPVEIASLNRGNTTNVDITFTDCTFPENESDIYVYLGATYKTLLDYAGSEYGIKPDNEGKASVNFTFKGGTNVPKVGVSDGLKAADVTLNGAVGYVAPFSTDNTNSIKNFSITEGKTWTFNNGLEIVKANDPDKQATLTYAANATGDTKAGTLAVGGTMTPANEDDVTAALKGDNPSASAFDVTGLEGWTSNKLAEKLNEKFYAEGITEGRRTEPFSGIKFICKDGESTVIVYSDKDAANADANPNAKYLIWDDAAKKYKTGEGSIETKSPITLTIKVSNLSDILSVKVNGEDATEELDGTYKVYAGQKLSVKFKTKSNYSVSAQINNTQYTNESEYTVPADVDKLEMKITYTYNPVPDDPTTPDPNPTEEVELSFDTAEKTVQVGDEFTLNVTVTGAESSRIVWTSSDSNVATVTSDGKVKAVGTGTATITARIGDVEAVCALTVEAKPTGIEAVSAGTKLYVVNGQIFILPAETVQITVHAVTGVCIYTGHISEAIYIPASAGIYLVTLSTDEGEVTEKVNVR